MRRGRTMPAPTNLSQKEHPNTEHSLSFSCDYMEGAHPQILQRLVETNLEKTPGYGSDCYCEAAKAKIREACNAPAAEIFFLVGGTQTNATVIDAMLKSYQGVIAASTGHISVHEAGAIEFGGHKVLTLPHHNGKISASQIRALLEQYQNDANHDHMVMPGMVYLSHPTEYGTLYSREELIEIRSSVSSRTPRWSGWQSRWNSASGKRMMIPIRSSALPQAGQPGRRTRSHCRTS